MDYSLPGSSVHGILQKRILEWVALPSSRGSSRPRDQTCVSYISCTDRQFLYHKSHLERLYTGSFAHGILQRRIPKCVAIPFSRGYSWLRDQTWVSCIAGRFFTIWANREVHIHIYINIYIYNILDIYALYIYYIIDIWTYNIDIYVLNKLYLI